MRTRGGQRARFLTRARRASSRRPSGVTPSRASVDLTLDSPRRSRSTERGRRVDAAALAVEGARSVDSRLDDATGSRAETSEGGEMEDASEVECAGYDVANGRALERGREAGWCRPAELGGKLSRERGMRSASNVDGVALSGFGRSVLTLRQWAHVLEDEDTVDRASRRTLTTMRAVRARSVRGLARVAMEETWLPGMLNAYLDAVFLRSIEQGKMVQCFTESGDAAWATFHTNLLSRDEFSLFAVFSRDFAEEDADEAASDESGAMTNGERWELCGFVDDIALRDPSQPWNAIEPILHVPPRATFVDDALDRLWLADHDEDVTLEIDAKFWSSLEANASVFPEDFSDAGMRQRAGMSAIPRLARLISYGYHVPVLRFARLQGQRGPGKIQMLLPFKVDARLTATQGAVVVDIIKSRRGGRMYRAVGVISLQEAAFSARVVGPLSSDWLSASAAEDSTKETHEEEVTTMQSMVKDQNKPAYASIANKPAVEQKQVYIRNAGQKRQNGEAPCLTFPPKIDDWYKATVSDSPLKILNPKANVRMLPFEFMQAVCKKLRIDDRILRLSDETSENDFGLIQALSVEASAWVRTIMAPYGTIARVYVGVSRKVRCFFAVVTFEKWTDLATRDALVNGENVEVKGFRCREKVFMRLSLENKRELM